MAQFFQAEGYTTSTALDGESALDEARRARPDLVLTDRCMPGINGIELCRRLHEIDPELPVIVMTADSDMHSVLQSLRSGVEDYLTKPLQLDAALWTVKRAIGRRAAKREQEEIRRKLNERLVLSSLREQELAEAAQRQCAQFTALLENLSEGVAIGDAKGRLVLLNDAARAILDLGERDLAAIQATPALACDVSGRPLALDERPLARAVRGETFDDYEVVCPRASGDRRRVMFTGASVKSANGDVELAIVVFRDVTQLRQLEQQRDEYLALISHDLRSPLGVILFSLETLRRALAAKAPMTAAEDMIARAKRNVLRMNVMLDELRESTTLEAGIELQRAPCDLRQIIANVLDTIDDAHGRRVTIESDDGSPYGLLADASRLERAVANLLTNALKYSAEGSPVTLRLTREVDAIELDVVDHGIGISPESVGRLFERYYRTTGGKAAASGLGLGLYIAHQIVEAHGGRLEVSSELGVGSTFKLILPTKLPA